MGDNYPFFSIVLPVFNRADKISGAIQSVIAQTFEDWELIIIDDCSEDSTAEVIQSFSDPRIRYFKNQKNSGPAFSRNIGIKNSKGQFISFLDSDDRYFSEFLTKTKFSFDNNHRAIGFCWTGLEVIYKTEVKLEKWNPEIRISPYYTFLHELKIGTNSGLSVRRQVFENCGLFNENLSAAEDTEFLLRIVQKFDFLMIKDVLISIDKSGRDRLSLNYIKNAKSYNIFIDQHWEMINAHQELMRKFYYKLMWLNFHLGDYRIARGFFKEFLTKVGPSSKVILIYLIFELFGSKIGSRLHILLSR